MQRTQLVVRFALELVALAAFGLAGWNLSGNQVMSVALAVLMPICAGLTWGIFRTPGDPSAGKSCKVAVPGWMRLTLEIGFFVLAAWSFWVYASRAIAETFLTLVGLHYLLTWERVRWLLTGRCSLETKICQHLTRHSPELPESTSQSFSPHLAAPQPRNW